MLSDCIYQARVLVDIIVHQKMTIATQPGEVLGVVMFPVLVDMVHNDDRLFLKATNGALLFLTRSHEHFAICVLTMLVVAVTLTHVGIAVPRETACSRTEKVLGPFECFALLVYVLPTLMTIDVLSFSAPHTRAFPRTVHATPAPYCRGLCIK